MLKRNTTPPDRINALRTINWDFTNVKTNRTTHSAHPYPAKFIPQIPYRLIQELSRHGDTVGDIFCGSGTTLVEATLLGRNAVGIDANPLACLISKAKTTRISSTHAEFLGEMVARATAMSKSATGFESDGWRPEYDKLTFWFPKFAIEELAEILSWCNALVDEKCKTLALTACSAIIVAVSRQDSDTRYVRREKNLGPGDVFKKFARALNQTINQAIEYSNSISTEPTCHIIEANLLDTPQIPFLDLMVCSPPYPNAYSYHLYHMTRMLWLGMDQPKFKLQEIGSHRKYSSKGKNAATVETFRLEMATILRWLSLHLKEGGYACFVVGNSTLRGECINNADLITEAGREAGFQEAIRLTRTMQATKKAFNPAIGRIKTEDILILENMRRA